MSNVISAAPAAPVPAPKVGFVSLGCPKALVDSEQILTQLRAEGYETAKSYEGADLVIVNTCGFIDAAVQESLDAIGEALSENGKVTMPLHDAFWGGRFGMLTDQFGISWMFSLRAPSQ